MNENQVLPLLQESLNIKGLDKKLKKEIKETLSRVGEYYSFLQKHDIERIIKIPENKYFDPKEMAETIIRSKLVSEKNPASLEQLLSIAARSSGSSYGPGLKDEALAVEILDKCMKNKENSGTDLVNLIIVLGDDDQWGDKERARQVALKILAEVDDIEDLEYAIEVVENDTFLGDEGLVNKLKEKISRLK